MKNSILSIAATLLLFLCAATMVQAQDVIVKNDRSEIKAKVTEITDAVIKYKRFDALDGPVYNINKPDVFMIIYQDGRKDYMNTPPAPGSSNPPSAPPTVPVDNAQEISDDAISLAMNSSGNAVDLEYAWFNSKPSAAKIGLGGDLYSGLQTSPYYSYGAYVFLQFKYSFGQTHDFAVWGNAGLNGSTVSGYYATGVGYVPTQTSYSFLWEVGANYFFSKHFGLTAYTSQGDSEWFGIVVR